MHAPVRRDFESLDYEEFRRRCLKPDPQRLGTWTARRWGRPVALRLTRLVAPHGISAYQATLSACVAATTAIAAFGIGTTGAWFIGVAALHIWYVLDHVDGQLARLQRTASLDGTLLDYLMHHSVNLLLPISIGFGIMRQSGNEWWCIVGVAWGWGSLVIGLRHDARYKSFVQRLKTLHGTLQVVGGGGGRPQPAYLPPRSLRHIGSWAVLKLQETHVVMLLLTLLALARLLPARWGEFAVRCYVPAMALPAVLLAVYFIARGIRRGEAEREFSLWFRVPAGDSLDYRDGWWFVETPTEKNVSARSVHEQDAPLSAAGERLP